MDTEALSALLARQLPEYMVPRHYMVLDRLPLSANGKVDRKALPQPWQKGAGTGPSHTSEPQTDTERQLQVIWCEVLNLKHCGVEEKFFDLGGDSLIAVRMVGDMQQRIGLPGGMHDQLLRALFQNPSIQTLAGFIDSNQQAKGAMEVVTV
jgi:pyochelin synthetase